MSGSASPSGAPCPNCSHPLRTTARELLTLGRITCTQCGLTLRLDPVASARSLALLREVDAAERRVERSRKPSL